MRRRTFSQSSLLMLVLTLLTSAAGGCIPSFVSDSRDCTSLFNASISFPPCSGRGECLFLGRILANSSSSLLDEFCHPNLLSDFATCKCEDPFAGTFCERSRKNRFWVFFDSSSSSLAVDRQEKKGHGGGGGGKCIPSESVEMLTPSLSDSEFQNLLCSGKGFCRPDLVSLFDYKLSYESHAGGSCTCQQGYTGEFCEASPSPDFTPSSPFPPQVLAPNATGWELNRLSVVLLSLLGGCLAWIAFLCVYVIKQKREFGKHQRLQGGAGSGDRKILVV